MEAVQMMVFTYLKFGRFSDGEEVEEARNEVSVYHLLDGWVPLLGEKSSEADRGKDDLSFARLIDQVVELLEIGLL